MKTIILADIHSQYDKLQRVLEATGFDPAADLLIGLGDYIDYGPDSPKVMNWLVETMKDPKHVFLYGNHEKFIYAMAVLGHSEWLDTWLRHGGEECLKSYGWNPHGVRWIGKGTLQGAQWYQDDQGRSYRVDGDEISDFMSAVFLKEHLECLTHLREMYELDDYVFTHDDLDTAERKNRVNIYAHYHEGLKVEFKAINIAAKHGEVGCLVLDDLSWYSSDGDYREVDREKLWSPGPATPPQGLWEP